MHTSELTGNQTYTQEALILGTSDAEVTLQYPNALATVAFMFQT
jgi:hypothetical protein